MTADTGSAEALWALLRTTAGDDGRAIVRHGLTDVLTWLGEDPGSAAAAVKDPGLHPSLNGCTFHLLAPVERPGNTQGAHTP